ncbi:MAG: guanylate kinase [Desulfohalobiaceae bacterium]
MRARQKGLALVICAPSGAGKSTLINRLRSEFSGFSFSVSYTTRAPRQGEVQGREYYFVEQQEFKGLIQQGFFAEWARVHGNYYGTPLQESQELMAQGKDLIFDIDVQGARQLRDSLDPAVFIFILPPSRAELEARLSRRGAEDPGTRQKRLEAARQELLAAQEFEFWVLNQDLEEAYHGLRGIYLAQKSRPGMQPGLLQSILTTWD